MRKTKIKTRLTVSLIAMCLFPVLILAGFFYKSYQDTIYNRLSASTKQGLVLYSTILDFHMGKCENISDGIMMDSTVQSALESRHTDVSAASPELNSAATQYFNNLFMWESYMKGFTICGVNSQPLAEMGFVKIAQPKLDALFAEFEPRKEYKTWTFLRDDNETPCIVLCRKIFSERTWGKLLGYVLVYVDPEQLVEAVNMGSVSEADNVLKIIVENEQDMIVLYDGKYNDASIEEVVPDYKAAVDSKEQYIEAFVAGNDSIVVVQEQSKTGWSILGVLPKSELTDAVRRTIAPITVAITFIIMLGLVFSAIIQRSIQNPIDKIVDFTKDVALGDFSKLLNDGSNDEIGFLSNNIDSMVTQISGLFEQNLIMEHKRHELELEVLQYQINPHFLFNTLNSFQYIAELNGIKSISQGVANLCAVLKYTLYDTETLPTLRQEIKIVDSYLKVQELKFAGMFTVSYDIDPVSERAQVIRFMLQPIVENSILHGLGESELHIRVKSEVDGDRLRVVVSDDGKGFDMDINMAEIGKSRFSGIGLSNVRERLAIRFGDDCSFIVESRPGAGTRATIDLPFIEEEEAETQYD